MSSEMVVLLLFVFPAENPNLFIKYFFNYVYSAVGFKINAKVYMSDDEIAPFNAWCEVMGAPAHRLLCRVDIATMTHVFEFRGFFEP